MRASKPIACKATSRMGFNQTARTFLGNLGLFGVPQKLGRAPGRNNACSIVPRSDIGCSHQRERAKNKRPADPMRVGRFSISDYNPIAVVLDLVHPVQPGWRAVTGGWEAGFDKAGGDYATTCKGEIGTLRTESEFVL